MMYKTHLVFGLLAGLVFLKYYNVGNIALFLGVCCFFAILADIDHPQSKIGRKIKPLSWGCNKLFGHRGVLHSIFPVIALYLVFMYILGWRDIALGAGVGYFSHILVDAFTIQGINFLNPVGRAKVSGFVETGSIVEWLFFVVFIVLIFFRVKAIWF